MGKPSASSYNFLSGKTIMEYSTYLIPIAFLLVVDNLWKKEIELGILFTGTLFFFIYFYQLDYFIKNYTKNNISRLAGLLLFALLFLIIFWPFYFVTGPTPGIGIHLLHEVEYQFQAYVNLLFLATFFIVYFLRALNKTLSSLTALIRSVALFLMIGPLFYVLRMLFITGELRYVSRYVSQNYGLLIFGFIGMSLIYVLIETVEPRIEERILGRLKFS